MSMARRFKGQPVTRLIVSVPVDLVALVDGLLKLNRRHPARGNRAEFVRLAIAEKLARDKGPSDDFSMP
jgi:metal-responsive CopG/Arc/MetJ family transcriptional regulator